jgi:2Fe-2S ferredoxin
MPSVTFIRKNGDQIRINAPENYSLMQLAQDNGIHEIKGICGGSMACATCHLYLHPDWVERVTAQDNEKSETEEDMLDMAFDVRETSRLGCQVVVTSQLDGLIVALPGAEF